METVLAFIVQHPNFFKTTGADWFLVNWHVMSEFERQALQVIARGRSHYSARTLVENLVHESVIQERGSLYKIGNHHAPDLARAFVVMYPEHIDFWEYRRGDWQAFKDAVELSFLD